MVPSLSAVPVGLFLNFGMEFKLALVIGDDTTAAAVEDDEAGFGENIELWLLCGNGLEDCALL